MSPAHLVERIAEALDGDRAGMTDAVPVRIKRLPHGEGLDLPVYATAGAAGMDVVSAENVTLAAGRRHAVATGLSLAIPDGYEIQVRPRSGLALKHGISVPNTPGTIDSDYRGELKVILINHGDSAFAIERGDRIAQLVLAPVTQAVWDEVEYAGRHGARRGRVRLDRGFRAALIWPGWSKSGSILRWTRSP